MGDGGLGARGGGVLMGVLLGVLRMRLEGVALRVGNGMCVYVMI